ncbi:hypothetical protein PRZ48_013110 [Zasmidium cellare]|uniref:Heme haloperoxidase family profile domain-containing protein n=1 Tax=Zasmidium cellare TaxID=395010 RepID=A0ABR0E339_ZASCE|nr:hypothetical protein PRZ48_013110 [Zasmidium cellare]
MIAAGIALLFASGCVAQVPAGHEYIAPGANDVRSPCPGINSLANHGFLPRSGKGLTLTDVVTGLKEGMNVGADFATGVGLLALMSPSNPLATSFDMDDLDRHNFPIEHDGSLSRADYYEGNDHSFNQSKWNQVLAYYAGQENTSIKQASLARYNRIQVQRALNPDKFIYGPRQIVLSYGETALYLQTMGKNDGTGVAPLKYVRSLFEQERLPYELGWQKPANECNLLTLGLQIEQLQLANPEALPEGLSLGEGALRDVIELLDPITGKLVNATCILLNNCD